MTPFAPGEATAKVTAATTSARVKVAEASGIVQVRLYNSGTVTAFLALGDSTIAATVAAGMPLPPGAVEVVSFATGDDIYLAGITASGTADVYATPGVGV